MKALKKISAVMAIVIIMLIVPLTVVYAETEPVNNDYDPDTQVTEAVTYEPETEAVTYEPETEAVTYEPETEAVTYEPETEAVTYEPETEAVTYEPETEAVTYEQYTEAVTYATHDVEVLPTLVDSTQVAAETPKAIGADAESGGVSFVGGVVCWICIGVAVAVIFAFLLSTTGKAKAGIGRYESGNKLGTGKLKY
jgi:hypothetical protein